MLSILVDFRIPGFRHFLLTLGDRVDLADLQFDPLPCSEHLTLQVKTPALLRIVDVEQFLEPRHDELRVGLATLGWCHVQDLAGLVERDAGEGVVSVDTTFGRPDLLRMSM